MDPNVRSLFDEVLKGIDDLRAESSGRWERWERRFEEATSKFQAQNEAVDHRIQSLEEFASAQYTAVVVDNWGGTSTSESLTSSNGWWISS